MVLNDAISAAQHLQPQIVGTIITPTDPDYDKLRRGWNLSVDQHPALILVAANAQDVSAGVRFAHEHGLHIGVQLTGHGVQLPADDSLLILTARMTGIQVDAEARTARVEAGVIWKQVVEATKDYGLAPLLGSAPHVGVVGYSLGGGIGWLARRFGLAADSVLSVDIVTADGVLRHTSPTENSDLFWAVRGTSGSFGVITAIEFSLYPVATIYGGTLVYPAEVTGEALRFFRDWVKTVPDELTSSIAIMKFPSLPQLPESMRGKTLVMVRAVYAGDSATGAGLIQSWLDWHAPLSNAFHEMPFAEIGTVSNDPVDPGPSYTSNEMFNELSDEAINVIVQYATNSASPFLFSELRHAGGAITRVAADANAIGNRDAQFYFQIGGLVFSPQIRAAMDAYLEQYKAALQPYLWGGVYLNFMPGKEAGRRVKDAYLPKTYERLVALKAKIDPDNVFRFSYQLVAPDA